MEDVDCVKCHACCLEMPIAMYDNEEHAELERPLWKNRGLEMEKVRQVWYVYAPACKWLVREGALKGECSIFDSDARPKACAEYKKGCDACVGMRILKELRGIK